MKTIKTKFICFLTALSLGALMLTLSNCDSKDDDANPCGQLECLNGGEKVMVDGCRCECPIGFTGTNCEIESDCPPSAECPMGQFANPANDCKCEPI